MMGSLKKRGLVTLQVTKGDGAEMAESGEAVGDHDARSFRARDVTGELMNSLSSDFGTGT